MKIYPISILCSTLPIYLSVLCEVFYQFPRQAWLYLPLHFHTIWIMLFTEEITLCYNYEFILPSRSSSLSTVPIATESGDKVTGSGRFKLTFQRAVSEEWWEHPPEERWSGGKDGLSFKAYQSWEKITGGKGGLRKDVLLVWRGNELLTSVD